MPRLKSRLPVAPGQQPLFTRKTVAPPALSSAQLRAARSLLGITQAELAQKLEIGQRTLAGWEVGLSRCAGPMCLEVLAGFYKLGVLFPAGGAGIPDKYKTGGRRAPTGDSVQLMAPAERWLMDEVMTDEELAEAQRQRKIRDKATKRKA